MTTPRWKASAARWASQSGTAIPSAAHRRSAHGHHGCNQRTADPRRRTRRARHHARLPGPASHRLPEPAQALRAASIDLPDMLYANGDRGRRARQHPTAKCCARWMKRRCDTRSRPRAHKDFDACAIVFLHGYRYPAHELRAAEHRARCGIHADLAQPRNRAADEIRCAAATRLSPTPISRPSWRVTRSASPARLAKARSFSS